MEQIIHWEPQQRQKESLVRLEDEILFGGSRGGGKAQPLDALVFDGEDFIRIGDIKIGDLIHSPVTGHKQEVQGIFPQGEKEVYRVSFIDGSSTECSLDHLWKVHFSCTKKKGDVYSLKDIKDILDRNKAFRATIPLYKPNLDRDNIELPINPYLLGLLIGDGHLAKAAVRISSADTEILSYILSLGYELNKIGKYDYSVLDVSNKNTTSLLGRFVSNKNSLINKLRVLGLSGKTSHHKFIPDIYKTASYEQKLELLKGLLDTDGTADVRGHVSYCSVSFRLANDVKELVWSLGGKASLKKKERVSGLSYNVYINFNNNEKCFKLKRKLDRVIGKKYNGNDSFFGRRIVDIEYVGRKECVCISVEDTLYVTNDYVVTHNTDAGQAWLLYDIDKSYYRGLVIRRNADDLRDWIDRAQKMYLPTQAQFVGNPTEIRFPSGAIIRTGHLKDSNAYTKYQGHEYHKILIEELTHIARESDYEALLGSLRSTYPDIQPQVFATTNPDGEGFYWVKERFNIPDHPNSKPTITTGKGRSKVFIFSKIEDNRYLLQNKDYVNYLESIQDETLKNQWRYGDWSEPKIEGTYYGEVIKRAKEEGRIGIIPYDPTYPVDTFWDIGIADSMTIWFVQRMGLQTRIIDCYDNSGEGFPFYKQILDKRGYIYGRHWAPHDIAQREVGSGLSRMKTAENLGIKFEMVPRIASAVGQEIIEGINNGRAFFSKCWFDTEKCKEGLKALSNYHKEFDEKRNEYKPHPVHDWSSHYADAFRYMAVTLNHAERKELSQANRNQIIPGRPAFRR